MKAAIFLSRYFASLCVGLVLVACQSASPTSPTIPPPSPPPPGPSTPAITWSNPSTWPSGKIPVAGEAVTIFANQRVILDVSTPNLKSLTVLGALEFADRDLELQAGYIMLHGALRIGSASKAFTNKATITLTATDTTENIMGMGTRGILVMGGSLELHGQSPTVAWTRIDGDAQINAKSVKLEKPVGWKSGDTVIVTPTEFYPTFAWNDDAHALATEQLELVGDATATASFKAGLKTFKWGKIQYATASGMSLTPTTSITARTLDERAEVGDLTRNIVIQGADDSAWTTQGFGAHVMAMRDSSLKLDGVELRRVGQLGRSGRYPIHWHMQNSDGTNPLPNTPNQDEQFVQNSSIWNSTNRCVTIHATNGVRFENNICFDIKGHAVFLEDGVERKNVIRGNLIAGVRNPPAARQFLKHDGDTQSGGSSGFWITNPDNTITDNVAADAQGNGFWLSIPNKPLGLNKAISIRPYNIPFGVFDGNVAHGNQKLGINFDWVVLDQDDTGATSPQKYVPTSDSGPDRYVDNRVRFGLNRVTVYKNREGGFWNRVSWPDYKDFVNADNGGTFFAGAGDDGVISGALVVGHSLNDAPLPATSIVSNAPDVTGPRVAFASYHSTFVMQNNTVVNFPFADAQPSGAFKTDDYYITAVDKGPVRNPGNVLINSNSGYRVLPKLNENWTLAGALWDPHGYWGPKGNFWVYDDPFLTSGATCVDVIPAGKNGKSCDGQYFGVGDYITDFDTNRYNFKAPLEVIRQDATGAEIGRWTVGDGNTAPKLGNMRHFAAREGGRYALRFPKRTGAGYDLPKTFEASITNAFRASDEFLLGISYDGSVTPSQVYVATRRSEAKNWQPSDPWWNQKRSMTSAASLSEVQNSSGDKYWRDTASNLIWVKFKGGIANPDHDNQVTSNPTGDSAIYGTLNLVIYP